MDGQMGLSDEFITAIKRLLKERNMSQRDLARLLDISDSSTSQLLNGGYRLGMDHCDKIAAVLNMKVVLTIEPIMSAVRVASTATCQTAKSNSNSKSPVNARLTDVTPEQLGQVFRRNLAEIRQSKGVSQTELSRMTGIPQPQLSALERGETRPNTSSIARIATALNVAPWTLLFTPENVAH